MSAHTPGPWRVAPPSVGRFKVCTVDGGKVVGEASNYCTDAVANARLIAAAPELLAALLDATHDLTKIAPGDDSGSVWYAIGATKETLRSAIAKATASS